MSDVFSDEWDARQRPRWNGRSIGDLTAQQLLMDDPSRQAFRRWIEGEVALLGVEGAAQIAPRLREERLFQSTVNELGAAALLRSNGFEVQYERTFDGLTPDWYAESPTVPGLIVEVVTKPNPHPVARRRWNQMATRVRRLTPPWTLLVRGGPLAPGPDDRVQKAVVAHLDA